MVNPGAMRVGKQVPSVWVGGDPGPVGRGPRPPEPLARSCFLLALVMYG